MSRLIESILLKLPLPVFYFDVADTNKWIIVDGLQRLSTLTVERRALGAKNPPTKFTKKRYKIMSKVLSKNSSSNSSPSKSKIREEVSLEII